MNRKKRKKICVVGNFSGRNAGDAAILEGLLNDVHMLYPEAQFLIPTINTKFVRKAYRNYPIKAISLLPWNLSLKILGLPIFTTALQSDLILITDAILFDRKLLNPLHNYLFTMSLLVPLANRRGIPVVLYNGNLGPATTSIGKKCLRKVIQHSRLIIVRDPESIRMMEKLALPTQNVIQGADCALNVPHVSEDRLNEIITNENLPLKSDRCVSINISSYLDSFVRGRSKGIDADAFITLIAEVMDRIVEELGVMIIFVITQPMDLGIAGQVLERVKNRAKVSLISNKDYSHNEIATILSRVEFHIGMRTHSLILATAACTPTVGIIATPKNRGYMQSIQQDSQMIDFGDEFTSTNLFNLAKATWNKRDKIRENLKPIIIQEKAKAKKSATYLKNFLSE